ncbi:TSUP family transporter [Jannaschia donghaensis]|uniref:Probable membrane transporter protein n=1 Tax=Jannaschia donghaensis TaxID=420998 RepID=A0A0M6YE81_9RHOB|nr:TSUP family transporter [Jannaschia donghaensis]CTQ48628.1 Sulfite exporter TauE/SafE [Jannaschia donghaensis]
MIELLPSPGVWAACLIAVVVGTAVQRLAGQGFGMVAAPMLALLAPDYLPGTVLLVGLCVGAGSFLSDRSAVVLRDLPPGFAGRALGAGIAAWIAARVVGTAALPLVTGLLVWLAVGLTLLGLRLPLTGPTLFAAGTVAGVMGTLTGIGAPPMAIVYSDVEARRSAATQNVFFAFGMAVSITALLVAGVIGLRHLAFAAVLAPAVPVTLWAVRPFAARVAKRSIRPWALGLAGTAAGVLIVRSLI